jgi:hypothetical protein
LAQKSLKIELRLKRYEVFKWQGLDCKNKSKTRARSGLEHNTGSLEEDLWDLQGNGLFFNREISEPSSSSVDRAALWSTVDPRMERYRAWLLTAGAPREKGRLAEPHHGDRRQQGM